MYQNRSTEVFNRLIDEPHYLLWDAVILVEDQLSIVVEPVERQELESVGRRLERAVAFVIDCLIILIRHFPPSAIDQV